MMRRLVTVVMLIELAACGSPPSLQITVEPPAKPEYKALIAKTVVTVYESELDDLTCDQIEHGDVSAERLLGAAVAEQTTTKDGTTGKLDDISRVGRKIVVARMYTAADALVAAGCGEQGTVDGVDTVNIQTEVAATVSVASVFDLMDPYGQQVTMVDPLGDGIANREVQWRVFAPSGTQPAATANVTVDPEDPTTWSSTNPSCTDSRGIVEVHPVPPTTVTGFATRFRVSWSTQPLEPVSRFVKPALGFGAILDSTEHNRCAIRTATERRIVCLEDVRIAPIARRYEAVQGPMKNFTLIPRGTVPAPGTPIGVVAVDEPAGKEVYAIDSGGNWLQLFGATAPVATSCPGCVIDDFRVLPACGAKPARLAMHSTAGATIRIVDIPGGTVSNFPLPVGDVTLNSAGCVSAINLAGDSTFVQILVLDFARTEGGAVTRGVFECGTGVCFVPLPFASAGVGFLRVGGGAKPESQMFGASLDAGSSNLIGWVLRATGDANTFHLIERQRIPAAGPPVNVLVGKLDSDDEPDLAWNIRGNRTAILQLSYAHSFSNTRLSALSQIADGDELVLGDVTGDGFDDFIGVGPNGFAMIPSALVGPDAAILGDTPCGP